MECEVIDTYVIDGFNNYICNILNTYVEEEMIDDKGKPDYEKLKPVLFEMPTYKYLRTGEVIGDCVKMGKAYAAQAGLWAAILTKVYRTRFIVNHS